MNSMARRMFELVEPIGVIPYSATNPTRRCSPWGSPTTGTPISPDGRRPWASPQPKWWTRSFYNSLRASGSPHLRRSGAPPRPKRRSPLVRWAARMRCADPRRRVDSAAFTRAAELLIKAATSAPLEGRPMYAALRAIPVPDDVWPACFTQPPCCGEHRGDGHIAA